jgi:hypothetical protein
LKNAKSLNVKSANIPVTKSLEIAGGASSFLMEPKEPLKRDPEIENRGAHFVPSGSAEPQQVPGEVLLDYIPPHPPLSNPRKNHRYVLTLLERSKEGEKLDTKELREWMESMKAGEDAETERPELQTRTR